MRKTKVLLASSEVVPFAKVGGLADVAGSLPKALIGHNIDIRVVMPKYRDIPSIFKDKMEYICHFFVDIGWRHQYCGVFKLVYENITYYFIDNAYYFDRKGLYGHYDECEQFTYFTRAFIEMLPHINFKPDIIHCNDWQTALTGFYLKESYNNNPFYSEIKTVYTIHNLKYQGVFPKEVLPDILGIDWKHFNSNSLEFYDSVNFMKAGILFSDVVNTVSPTYSQEVLTEYYGEKLNYCLKDRLQAFSGILNGIDYDIFNPETDKEIYQNYSASDISGKYTNKRELQKLLNLPLKAEVPIISIISRLVDQKGLDLIEYVLNELLSEDLQLIILGTGEKKYEDMFRHYAKLYPDKISANLAFNADLAQKIYSGSDLFLMPSLFEPCGLSQLISLRYGTIPIVRETGGLKDTVKPYNEFDDTGYGFTFSSYNAHDMLYTIRRALSIYKDTQTFSKLVKRAMQLDYSWNSSGKEYSKLYQELLEK